MSAEEQATVPAADASTNAEVVAPKEEGVKVFAGNLSYKSTDDDLKALFEPLGGDILSIQIVFRGARSSGYGFVAYKNQADADKAVQELNGKDIGGRDLVVELAKPPQPKERKPKAKKSAAPRAPRAEDAVDGEEETAQNGEAAEEQQAKPKRTRAPRRRGPKKDADGNPIPPAEPTADGEAPATKAPRARKPKAAPRIDDEAGEPAAPAPRAPRARREPRPPREAPTGEPSKTLIFVANLPFSLDDEGLNKIFTDGGVQVSTARIVKRKFGIKRSKGFGFVDTASEEEQKKALALDGTEVESRAIAVKVALNSQQDPEATETKENDAKVAQETDAGEANAAAAAAEPTTDATPSA